MSWIIQQNVLPIGKVVRSDELIKVEGKARTKLELEVKRGKTQETVNPSPFPERLQLDFQPYLT
jgi:hypothetical protein